MRIRRHAGHHSRRHAAAAFRGLPPAGGPDHVHVGRRRPRVPDAYRQQGDQIMSVGADGTIRPHKVERIVKTGRKFVYRVRCESGRQIKITTDHRLLTTEGYLPLSEMSIGTELITTPMISDKQREARRET